MFLIISRASYTLLSFIISEEGEDSKKGNRVEALRAMPHCKKVMCVELRLRDLILWGLSPLGVLMGALHCVS